MEGHSCSCFTFSKRHLLFMFGSLAFLALAYLANDHLETWWLTRKYDRYFAERIHLFRRDHSATLVKRIEKVTDGIYVALGYGLANSVFIEAPQGVIVVDTMESMEAALDVFRAYRSISNSTVRAIIYTHHHADHISGTKAFVQNSTEPLEIWAHPDLVQLYLQVSNTYSFRGSIRQFGSMLPTQLGSGIGKQLKFTEDSERGFLEPTHFVDKPDMEVKIAGMSLRLLQLPGESNDQIGIWLPNQRALISADNVYKAFPNLYAIRGSRFRNPLDWTHSLEIMRRLTPRLLIPCHLEFLEGEEIIQRVLSDYRDAIQYVHDQSVRHINLGTHPDEAAQLIKLPQRLAQNPYLDEFYGTIPWSVKSIYSGYVGWFSSFAEELNPLTPSEKAKRLVQLAGGVGATLRAASEAVEGDDPQWALELASAVLSINLNNFEAKWIYVRCLVDLAVRSSSANGRNYYLTAAEEALSRLNLKMNEHSREHHFEHISLEDLAKIMQTRLIGDRCSEFDLNIVYNIVDTNRTIGLQMRGGLFEYTDNIPAEAVDATIFMYEDVYKRLMCKKAKTWTLVKAILQGKWWIKGSSLKALRFTRCIEVGDSK